MRGKISLYQGDIVLVPFSFSDQTTSKVRPAIVISNPLVNKGLDVLLAAITSTIRNEPFSFKLMDKDVTKPLDGDSEIRCDKIMTCDKTLIQKKILP